MPLGERLKALRNQIGFSQEMVAERVGVSRQAVTKWESGQTIPTGENLAALAELYAISLDELMEDRSGWVKDGEDNPILRENRTVMAISAQLGALYACVWTLQDMPHGEQLGGGYLLPLFGNIVMLALCSMWMVWNLSCELDLDRRPNNLKIELRYMLAQLLLTVLSFYFHLGLAGFLLSIAILLFYLRVINPRYMGRKLWWKKPKRAVCKMKKGSRDGS